MTEPVYKIALVVESLKGGGAEKVCLDLAKALTNEGHRVFLLVLKRVQQHTPSGSYFCTYIFDTPDLSLYSTRTIKLAALRLEDICRQHGPFDLTLTHLEATHAIMARCNWPNTWYVVHNALSHKLKREWHLGPIKYWRARRAIQQLHGKNVICVSQGVQQDLLSLTWLKPNSIATIYNPIDVDAIRKRAEEPCDKIPETPYLIHIGRVARQKRHDRLFDAVAQLSDPLRLVLLCEPSKKLHALIARHQLQDRVIVAGWQANPYPWIKKAQALVLSSDYEGFGLVLAEALALNTPVASTNCPHGPGEILGEKLQYCLAELPDSKALAQAIEYALTHRQLFHDHAEMRRFSPTESAKSYIDLLKQKSAHH